MQDAQLLVLASLSDGAKHGYAIQADVLDFAGVRLGPGTLYGAIARLERRGDIVATDAKHTRRKPYRLTSTGRATLSEQLAVVGRIAARVAPR
jgi:DNA-binding PadR family transcriptional regulator